MAALCVNCLAWHGSDTDNTLCSTFLSLPKVAHDAFDALPKDEQPEWGDQYDDVWIAGFYAGFRSAVGLDRAPAASSTDAPRGVGE